MNEELPLNYRRLESAMRPPSEVYKQAHAANWHDKQSNPTFDTAAKKLARETGHETVRCICGCRQEFPSAVSG